MNLINLRLFVWNELVVRRERERERERETGGRGREKERKKERGSLRVVGHRRERKSLGGSQVTQTHTLSMRSTKFPPVSGAL